VAEEADDDDSDDEGNGRNRVKWRSLEHHGVIFSPAYKPHGVKILHKGAPLDLTPEQEEVCNYWANIIGSEFAEKEKVIQNFEKSLLAMF
jgi:DNA topoisomerase-1